MMKLLFKIISAVLLWGVVVYIIVFIDPEVIRDVGISGAYLPLFLPLGLALWYTIIVVLQSAKVAMWIAGAVVFLLILNAMKVLTVTTLVITIAMLGLVLFRFLKRKSARQ